MKIHDNCILHVKIHEDTIGNDHVVCLGNIDVTDNTVTYEIQEYHKVGDKTTLTFLCTYTDYMRALGEFYDRTSVIGRILLEKRGSINGNM